MLPTESRWDTGTWYRKAQPAANMLLMPFLAYSCAKISDDSLLICYDIRNCVSHCFLGCMGHGKHYSIALQICIRRGMGQQPKNHPSHPSHLASLAEVGAQVETRPSSVTQHSFGQASNTWSLDLG